MILGPCNFGEHAGSSQCREFELQVLLRLHVPAIHTHAPNTIGVHCLSCVVRSHLLLQYATAATADVVATWANGDPKK